MANREKRQEFAAVDEMKVGRVIPCAPGFHVPVGRSTVIDRRYRPGRQRVADFETFRQAIRLRSASWRYFGATAAGRTLR